MDFDWLESPIRALLMLQRSVQGALGHAFFEAAAVDQAGQSALVMLLAAFFGMVHAIGPGHGKSIMMAYFVGQEAKVQHGLMMSIKLIVTHVGSAILLVLAAATILEISFGFRPADFPVVQQVSYAGVAGVGVFLLVQSIRGVRLHANLKVGGMLPYIVGLSPCPLTTIIMLAAIGTGAIVLGLLVSVAMALGMVATVSACAFTAILARRWLFAALNRHMRRIVRIGQIFEIIGAVGVTAIGALLFFGGIV